MKPEEKKCVGESCECSNALNTKKDSQKNISEKPEAEEIKPDPTRFGDWQVNGRAIDF